MEITLSVSYRNRKGVINFETIRNITEEEYEKIDEALNRQNNIEYNEDIYKILRKNYAEILRYYTRKKREIEATQLITNRYGKEISLEIERLLINYLTSIKLFLEFNKTNLAKSDPECLLEFEKERSRAFDRSFGFRFLNKLRDCVQHCGLPGISINLDFKSPKGAEKKPNETPFIQKLSINFVRDNLLRARFNWTSKVKREIKNHGKHIEVIEVLKQISGELKRLFVIADRFHKIIYANSAAILYVLSEEFRTSGVRGTPCIVIKEEIYEEPNGARIFDLSVTPLPIILISK